jgi:hypothetical protein
MGGQKWTLEVSHEIFATDEVKSRTTLKLGLHICSNKNINNKRVMIILL